MGMLRGSRAPVGFIPGPSSMPANSKPSPQFRNGMLCRARWCQSVPASGYSSGVTEELAPKIARRPGGAEAGEAGIAADAGQSAEHLVERAVLLGDEQHAADRGSARLDGGLLADVVVGQRAAGERG